MSRYYSVLVITVVVINGLHCTCIHFPPSLPWLHHIHVFIPPPPPFRDFNTYMYSFPPSPPWLQHIHVFISPLPFVTSTHTCIHSPPPPPMTSTHNVLHPPPPPPRGFTAYIYSIHPPPPPPPPVTSLHTYIRSFPSLAEVRSCVKVEVAVLGSTCPYGLCGRKATLNRHRGQEPCESGGGRPGLHLSLRSLWT